MEKIASFTVNHIDLEPGVYVSRRDTVGSEPVTTFYIRMTSRNDPEWGPRTVYFGPMGCRTGFYLVAAGELGPADVLDVLTRLFTWAASYDGPVPGAAPRDCGNYLDINLPMARWEARRYLDRCLTGIDEAHTVYPA